MWYVFIAPNPLKAAATLRHDGLECIVHMTHAWKRVHRTAKARKPSRVPVPAYGGYFFLRLPDDAARNALRVSKAQVRAVAVDGHNPRPLRDPEAILTPPRGLFHDTEVPRYVAASERPAFKAGDKVIFSWSGMDGLHSQVMQVQGDKLRVALKLCGVDFVDVPADAVRAA